MTELDPRLNPYRDDLAAESLRDQISAPRYVAGVPAQVRRGVAALRRAPWASAPQDTQLLSGETVTVYDRIDDEDGAWAWVQNDTDGYVGYLDIAALSAERVKATHWVTALRTFVFPEADIKTPPLDTLTMTGRVAVLNESGRFAEIAGGGFVVARHLAPLAETAPDYTATALQFLGAPYLWGGKESLGLDCSGLVQVVLQRAGIACPRDTYMQAKTLGRVVAEGGNGYRPAHGDLIFMPGHVAIALDETRVVHANAGYMMVTVEPLEELKARVAEDCGRAAEQTIDVVRRLD